MGSQEPDVPAKLIERIAETFGHDLDAWLACFQPPFAFVTPEATLVAADEAEARLRFGPAFESLQGSGFASSVADEVTTRYLGEDIALVDASFTRHRRDGSQMGRMAALYVCRRYAEGWRIAAVIQHPPDDMAFPAAHAT